MGVSIVGAGCTPRPVQPAHCPPDALPPTTTFTHALAPTRGSQRGGAPDGLEDQRTPAVIMCTVVYAVTLVSR